MPESGVPCGFQAIPAVKSNLARRLLYHLATKRNPELETTMAAKMTKVKMAELLATAMNLLNGIEHAVDGDGAPIFNAAQLGQYHALSQSMPASVDYANNGTVTAKDLI